jgi:hypothetical protein
MEFHMSPRIGTGFVGFVLAAGLAAGQQAPPPADSNQPKLQTREELAAPPPPAAVPVGKLWIMPAGTKIPVQLRQALSTKDARPGDPVYAQTSFPVLMNGNIVIPAGTWVQGEVDHVKRAGRIKGTAELQFHLTTFIYANGYSVNMAAAIDRVPGSDTTMKEPDTVQHDPEKGKDLERVGNAAAKGAVIGTAAGAITDSIHGIGVGGISGIAAGTLIALLTRGTDVKFDPGTGVEIVLNHAIGVEADKARAPAQ